MPDNDDLLTEARRALQHTFGHHDFIGTQATVISHLLTGHSTLALMPTGGGKSLCYQLPALILPGTAIVISPLIALMKDQVDQLTQHNIRAAALNSSQTPAENQNTKDKFTAGELDLLYIAPERLISGDGLNLIHQTKISLIAIDEAHCISQWGHDFRPEYIQLGALASELPHTPRLALTATADTQTRQEIIEKLHLDPTRTTIASFDRPNIRYHIHPKENTRQHLLNYYRTEHQNQPGIIYCLSRRRTEETADWLQSQNIPALPYHAGMDPQTRQTHQERFLREDLIICATIAFGMGINKPDVRFVAHIDLPKSIEAYYQETGRAGRDGLPASAILYYSIGDTNTLRRFIEDSDSPDHIRRIEHQKIDTLTTYCETHHCRRQQLLNHFGEPYTPPCNNCDNCLTPPTLQDGTIPAQKLLSAAARSQQRFGITHLVDILTGKETEKIQRNDHHKLPTYGIGADTPAAEWKRIARQLIAQNLLQPEGEYSTLTITEKGWQTLRGEHTVQLKKQPPKQPKTEQQPRPARAQPSAQLDEWQLQTFEHLRAERQRIAKEQNIPAYVVFHDTTLIELARQTPTTEEQFQQIPGIGAAKTERYAADFIKIIKEQLKNQP